MCIRDRTSTFLGNGIAIPHGTTDTRDQVLKTGVKVYQFPQGVVWGEGQVAYVAIGIAASSDEHLGLLRQLTHVLSDDAVAEQLKSATTAEELRAWYKMSGLPLKKFFNTSGLIYKDLGLKDKLPALSEEEQLALLATDGMLVKRPLLIGDGFALAGFREADWERALNG